MKSTTLENKVALVTGAASGIGKASALLLAKQGGPGDSVIVVVNLANLAHENYTIGFPRAGTWRVRFNSDFRGYDESFGNHLGYDTTASPGAKDGMPCSGSGHRSLQRLDSISGWLKGTA